MIGKHSSSTSTRLATAMDLGTIDEAYGPFADLYSDVLQISVAASHQQIQLACLDRRSELFRNLSRLDARRSFEVEEERQALVVLEERRRIHGKIDSVALAARILGDPDHRLEYDVHRQGRLLNRRRHKNGHLHLRLPESPRHVRGLDAGIDAEEEGDDPYEGRIRRTISSQLHRQEGSDKENTVNAATRLPLPSSAHVVVTREKKTKWMEEQGETREIGESSTRQDVGDATQHSQTEEEDVQDESYISSLSHIIGRLAEELGDACEDTLLSVDQVFNAFTLTGKDIRAVTRRIERAKREVKWW
jgi:hypothetical protein